MNKTICELFAGVGGFRLGFESQSHEWQTVWANQWEPNKKVQHAFNCYHAHFNASGGINEFSNTDINSVEKFSLPQHTLLVGGFPCQDYSVARTGAQGIHGKKGVLWWDIHDILISKKPPFVLLENVDRLIKSPARQRGRDFAVILSCLNNLGYNAEWRVVNAAEYGFQQRRRRIFIFASHKSNNFSNIYALSPEIILHKSGFFARSFPVSINDRPAILSTPLDSDIERVSTDFKYEFMNTGFLTNGTIYTTKTIPVIPDASKRLCLKDVLDLAVDESYYLKPDSIPKWEIVKGAKAIERTSKTGHKYMFREGAVPFPDPLDKPARTMLTSESSTNRSSHIISDPKEKRLRKLTPTECERINGFPSNWTNTGMPHNFRYFCMGNALVVDLIKKMANTLYGIIESEN